MKVVPKPWPNPIQDGIIVDFSNFWIGLYPKNTQEEALYFRLSSYDARKYGAYFNAQEATEYINLDPIKDIEIIQKILENSVMIYTPDIDLVFNLRTL